MVAPIVLSTVKPDFESLLLQLQLFLQNKATWTDLLTSSTGETILEAAAAVGTFNQFGIESAAREAYLKTSLRASSIYAITQMLGVRITRKSPAVVTVNMTRTAAGTTQLIPKFTTFTISGATTPFFNRDPIMFLDIGGTYTACEQLYLGNLYPNDDGTLKFVASDENIVLADGQQLLLSVLSGPNAGQTYAVVYNATLYTLTFVDQTNIPVIDSATSLRLLSTDVSLYAGTVEIQTYVADTTQFRQISLPESAFVISDSDVQVIVINPYSGERVLWTEADDGIWMYGSTDNVYIDTTDGDGYTVLGFGDGTHGAIPTLSSTIEITYATCNGSIDNLGSSGLQVACTAFSDVTGISTSIISGGSDEKSAAFYRYLAPYIFKARRRAVTKDDYMACALGYPGVVSATIQAQRDIAPGDLRWMNVIRVCLLPLDPAIDQFSDTDWENFMLYMQSRQHEAVHLQKYNPLKRNAKISLTVFIYNEYTPSDVLPQSTAAVQALFARQINTLGRSVALGDVLGAAKVTGVDYVDALVCNITDFGTAAIGDLTVPDVLHFIELDPADLTINVQYTPRSQYNAGTVIS